MTTPRLFIVRGSSPTIAGREVSRAGEQVTINAAEIGWPFPTLRTFNRSELIFAGGPGEPQDVDHPQVAVDHVDDDADQVDPGPELF